MKPLPLSQPLAHWPRPSSTALGAAIFLVWLIAIGVGRPRLADSHYGAGVPSLIESVATGHYVSSPDTGPVVGLVGPSYADLKLGTPRLWEERVGAGRPLFPIDGYNTGVVDPIQWLAISAFGKDLNRIIPAIASLYILLIVAGVMCLLSAHSLSLGASALAVCFLLAHRHLQHYPHFVMYLAQTAGVIWTPLLARRMASARGIGQLLSVSFLFALAWLNCFPMLFPQSVLLAGSYLVCARLAGDRSTGMRSFERLALGLALALSLCLPHLLPARQFAALSTNPLLPYVGYGVNLKQGGLVTLQNLAPTNLGAVLCLYGVLHGAFFRRASPLSLWPPFLLLVVWLGLSGLFDPLALLFGANIQPLNTFIPLMLIVSIVGIATSVDALVRGELKLSLLGISVAVAALGNEEGPLSQWIPIGIIAGGLALLSVLSRADLANADTRKRPLLWPALIASALFFLGSSTNNIIPSYALSLPISAASRAAFWLPGLIFYVGARLSQQRPLSWHNTLRLRPCPTDLFLLLMLFVAFRVPIAKNGLVVTADLRHLPLPAAMERIKEQAGNLYRVVSLHRVKKEDPRLPEAVSYSNLDSLAEYPLLAPLFGFHDASGGASLTPRNYSDFVDFGNYGTRWEDSDHPAHGHLPEYRTLMLSRQIRHYESDYGSMAQIKRNGILVWNPASRLWRFNATRYLFSSRKLNSSPELKLLDTIEAPITYGRQLRPAVYNERLYLYENLHAYPRAYVPDVVDLNPNVSRETLAKMRDHRGPSRLAVVHAPPVFQPRIDPRNRVLSVSDSTNQVTIETEMAAGSFVVLSDVHYPGWSALVDGEPTPLYKANYCFRAVWVPKGKHRVTMHFMPQPLVTGLRLAGFVCALALLGVGIAAVLRLRRLPVTRPVSTPV